MQLLHERDLPCSDHDIVCRYSCTRGAFAFALLFAGCVALAVVGVRRHTFLLELAAVFLAGGEYLGRRFLTARFRPSNWLVRANDNGLYVKFRSYLNYHFPAENLTVAFIPYREIAAARSIREQRSVLDFNGGRSVQTRRLVELELSGDATALRGAIAEENARPAPNEKRWYGKSSVRFEHEPVAFTEPASLKLLWECVPAADRFLEMLGKHVSIRESIGTVLTYEDVASLSRPAQEQRLAELARSGQALAAIMIARRLYAFDLAQAREFVESLRRGTPTSNPQFAR